MISFRPPENYSNIFTVLAGMSWAASAAGVADVAEEPIQLKSTQNILSNDALIIVRSSLLVTRVS